MKNSEKRTDVYARAAIRDMFSGFRMIHRAIAEIERDQQMPEVFYKKQNTLEILEKYFVKKGQAVIAKELFEEEVFV